MATPGRRQRSAELPVPDRVIVSGLLRRKASGDGIASDADRTVDMASSSAGHALPMGLQRKFESSLGTDLSSVRVHTGSGSQAAAHAVSAKAYAVGNDIHFGAGYYDPSSSAGEHLLAHEVAHTQQQRGTPAVQFKLQVSSTDDAHEIEADRAADAMIAGAPAAVGSTGGGVHRKVDPTTTVVDPNVADPDHNAHVDVAVSGKKVSWDDKQKMADGTIDVTHKTGLDMYGADAQVQGIVPDPNDPYATDPAKVPTWQGTSIAGPDVPNPWVCDFIPKQPLPVRGPDPMKIPGSPGPALTPMPLQESQVAYAQSAVDAFRKPYDTAKRSWETITVPLGEFSEAGRDPLFYEGGLNWITKPFKDASDTDKGKNMEQLASAQTVGDGKTTVADLSKLSAKDLDGLKSTLPKDEYDVLDKEAGKPAALHTACELHYDTIATLTGDQRILEGKVRSGHQKVDLSKLGTTTEQEKALLAKAQTKQHQLTDAVEKICAAIEFGLSIAVPKLHEMPITAAKSIIMLVASSHYEADIERHGERILELSGEMAALSSSIATTDLTLAAEDLKSNAKKIKTAKGFLATALHTAEAAQADFAKVVGAKVGGKKGAQVRAAIEALPKVALLAKNCETIAAAAKVPAYTPKAGLGMLGAAVTPQQFLIYCGQLQGYHDRFTAKAKVWAGLRDQLDEIAKSYGLGK